MSDTTQLTGKVAVVTGEEVARMWRSWAAMRPPMSLAASLWWTAG